MLKFANCLFRMLTLSLFTHCISQNNELGSFAVLEIKFIQWIRLDDCVGTICQLAIYIWKGSLVIFRSSHCEFPPIDYELAASIELGNLGHVNLPEIPSFHMVDGVSYALCTYNV